MNKKQLVLLTVCFILLHSSFILSGFAQGTAFTYQGRLNSGTNPANGSYDLKLSLFNVSGGGSAIAGPLTNAATAVSNGLFTVTLDFGAAFDGNARWLEIGVRTNGGGAFTALTPRQQITAAPYAIYSGNAAALGGSAPAAYAPASGSTAYAPATNSSTYVSKAGDNMGGPLGVQENAPGIVAAYTAGDTFSYAGHTLNNYGFGFHHFQDPNIGFPGVTPYLSGYFGIDFFTASLSRMRIGYNGNVGIGITNPAGQLHVRSPGVTGPASKDASLILSPLAYNGGGVAGGRYGLQFKADNDRLAGIYHVAEAANFDQGGLAFEVAGSGIPSREVMRIAGQTGNVGIGTASPSHPLTVVAPTTNTDVISWRNPNGELGRLGWESDATSGAVMLWNGVSLAWGAKIDAHGATWFNGGNVGIGTGTPTTALEVHREVLIKGNGANGAEYNDWPVPSLSIRRSDDYVANGVTMMSFGYRNDPNYVPNNVLTNDSVANIRLWDEAQPPNAATSATTTQLRIAAPGPLVLQPNAGKVGIGTASPQSALHVVGTVTATSFSGSGAGLTGVNAATVSGLTTNALVAKTGDTMTGALTAPGVNVNSSSGLNVTASTAKLSLTTTNNAANGAQIWLENDSPGSTYLGSMLFLKPGDIRGSIGYLSSDNLDFKVLGSERMRITGTGRVGIGTDNPQSTLHVNGQVRAEGLIQAVGGLVIENRTSDPPSPAVGQIWLRTDL